MKSITEAKGLGDIRTAISTRARSASRQKSSAYLDILALGMEKMRLETELAWMGKRQKRLEERFRENQAAMEKLLSQAQQDQGASLPAASQDSGERRTHESAHPVQRGRSWRSMTVEY